MSDYPPTSATEHSPPPEEVPIRDAVDQEEPMDVDMADAATFLLASSSHDSKAYAESEAEVSQQLYPHDSSLSLFNDTSNLIPEITSTPPDDDNPFLSESRPRTPPPAEPSIRLPPTPVALTAEEKTARFIAQVKADAMAKARQETSDEEIEFKDLSDDDSDSFAFPSVDDVRRYVSLTAGYVLTLTCHD